MKLLQHAAPPVRGEFSGAARPRRRRAPTRGGFRAGFTLVELVAAMAVAALFAAVLFPVVTQMLTLVETHRVVRDIENLRVAIQQFNVSTRTLPRYIVHLSDVIATNDSSAYEVRYSEAEVRRWNGPYADLHLDPEMRDEDTADAWVTGYGGRVYNALYCYDPETGFTSFDCPQGTFSAVRVDGLTGAQFARINEVVDGDEPNTLNANGVPQSWEQGQLRFVLSQGIDINSSIGVLFYLILPSRQGL